MTVAERLAKAHEQSTALYLRRTDLQAQIQQLQGAAHQIDAELLRLDGEVRLCDALIAEHGKDAA